MNVQTNYFLIKTNQKKKMLVSIYLVINGAFTRNGASRLETNYEDRQKVVDIKIKISTCNSLTSFTSSCREQPEKIHAFFVIKQTTNDIICT